MKLGKPHNIIVKKHVGNIRRKSWDVTTGRINYHIRMKLTREMRLSLRIGVANIRLNIDL